MSVSEAEQRVQEAKREYWDSTRELHALVPVRAEPLASEMPPLPAHLQPRANELILQVRAAWERWLRAGGELVQARHAGDVPPEVADAKRIHEDLRREVDQRLEEPGLTEIDDAFRDLTNAEQHASDVHLTLYRKWLESR